MVRVTRILRGKADLQNFKIVEYHGPGSCPPSVPLPKVGDLWLVYVKHGSRGLQPESVAAYPLEVVRGADPSMKDELPTSVAPE
jgi:hypothetical protein